MNPLRSLQNQPKRFALNVLHPRTKESLTIPARGLNNHAVTHSRSRRAHPLHEGPKDVLVARLCDQQSPRDPSYKADTHPRARGKPAILPHKQKVMKVANCNSKKKEDTKLFQIVQRQTPGETLSASSPVRN